VGDGAVGKTCVISRMANQTIDWDREPDCEAPTFNNFIAYWDHPTLKHQHKQMEIWDVAAQEVFLAMRAMAYPDTKVFYVAYAVNQAASLSNVETKWIPEISFDGLTCAPHSCADDDPWVILIGTKADLRDEPDFQKDCIPLEDCEAVAKKIGACMWIETSSKANTGITRLQDALMCLAAHRSMGKPKPMYDDRAWFIPGLSASEEPTEPKLENEFEPETKGFCQEAPVQHNVAVQNSAIISKRDEDIALAVTTMNRDSDEAMKAMLAAEAEARTGNEAVAAEESAHYTAQDIPRLKRALARAERQHMNSRNAESAKALESTQHNLRQAQLDMEDNSTMQPVAST